MWALPSKDTSEKRDEPLASEDEVEHEEDSLDVELWRNKLVAWEAAEVVRRRKKFVGKFQAQKQFSHEILPSHSGLPDDLRGLPGHHLVPPELHVQAVLLVLHLALAGLPFLAGLLI